MKRTIFSIFLIIPLIAFSQNENRVKLDRHDVFQKNLKEMPEDISSVKLTLPDIKNSIDLSPYKNGMVIVNEKQSEFIRINPRFFITNSSRYVRYPGLGEVYSIRSVNSFNATDRLILSFGYGAVRSFTPLDFNAVLQLSFYSSVEYQLTDWLYLKLYGQYITSPINKTRRSPNVYSYMNPMYPQSQAGADLFLKYKNLKVNAGPKYLFDTEFNQAPVVRSFNTKVSIGF